MQSKVLHTYLKLWKLKGKQSLPASWFWEGTLSIPLPCHACRDKDASYHTGKEDACGRPTPRLQNTGLPTQNTGSSQKLCFKEHQNCQVMTFFNKDKQGRKAFTLGGWEKLQNSAGNGRTAAAPDMLSHLHAHLGFLTLWFLLSLPCHIPSHLIPRCCGIQFSDDLVPKRCSDPDHSQPWWFISSSRWDLLCYHRPIANRVTMKYLGARISSNDRLITLRITS